MKLKTSEIDKIARFTDALQHIRRAISWGGYESLVIPFAATRTEDTEKISVVRLHSGLEDPALLIEDLSQALEQLQ